MELDRRAREFWTVEVNADPPINIVEASFDDGATWWPGEYIDGHWRWLVQGPDAPSDPQAPAVVVPRSCAPLLRIPDPPEIIVRRVRGVPVTIRS